MGTGIQVLCLAVLYALKAEKATAVAFPFFIALLVFIRRGLGWVFTKEELEVLDAADDLPPDEPVEKTEPTVVETCVSHDPDQSESDPDRKPSKNSILSKGSKISHYSEDPS